MTYQEWFWLYDVKRADQPVTFGLNEDDLADLYELITEPKADG
jgi:hypothetical protein